MASGTTLETYRRKRDFRKTPEPKGGKRRAAGGNLFVVQKHHASRLHYDFRLQVDGVLASWAVPKGPSLNPADKRLAVHVEDHPLDYGSFEGVIPKGEYGGGTVLLWDHGTWTSEDGDPARAIRKGKISFTLDGEKLHGGWTLTRLHGRRERDDDHDNWLLIKRKDDSAETDGDALLEKRPESVKSGRSLEEIAEEEEPTSFVRSTDGGGRNGASRGARSTAKKTPSIRKRRPAGRRTKTSTSSARIAIPDPAAVPGARESGMPRVVSPQLCTLIDDAPEGDEWIHEIKFDGYRIVARRTARSVSLLSRNQHDWTSRLKPIANAIVALPVDTIILDGEAVILDRHGHSSFQLLQNAIKARQFNQLAYFAFDLLYLNGYDLREAPLLERKRLLEALFTGGAVEGGGRHGMLRYSDHVVGGGPGVRSNACELALEGIISKRADAP